MKRIYMEYTPATHSAPTLSTKETLADDLSRSMLSSLGNQHDAVTAVRSDAHARLPPSHRHVGGRQPSVSGWSPRKIDGSEASHTQSSPDAVTGPLNHGSSTHVGGRQDSISGWSRKMVPESGVAHTHDAVQPCDVCLMVCVSECCQVTQLSGDTHVRVGGVSHNFLFAPHSTPRCRKSVALIFPCRWINRAVKRVSLDGVASSLTMGNPATWDIRREFTTSPSKDVK